MEALGLVGGGAIGLPRRISRRLLHACLSHSHPEESVQEEARGRGLVGGWQYTDRQPEPASGALASERAHPNYSSTADGVTGRNRDVRHFPDVWSSLSAGASLVERRAGVRTPALAVWLPSFLHDVDERVPPPSPNFRPPLAIFHFWRQTILAPRLRPSTFPPPTLHFCARRRRRRRRGRPFIGYNDGERAIRKINKALRALSA